MKRIILFSLTMLLILCAGIFLIVNQYCLPAAFVSTEDELRVTFLDVGQGDAALVGCGSHWMLIDGGDRSSSRKIYAVLKERNITHLELVVASHPHEDHIGGLSAAFQIADVEQVLSPTDSYDSKSFQNLQRFAGEQGTGITVPKAGDIYRLGSARVEVLGLNAGSTENACSLIVRVSIGNQSFLFPGDMEAESICPNWDLSATVLKVSHHGSRTGTNRDFLDNVSPKYAVISLASDNTYGMPHGRVLELLKESGVSVFRTDLQGDITFTTNGNTLQVSTQKNAASRELLTPGDGSSASGDVDTFPNTYVVNTSSGTFHESTCPSVNQMKESNKRYSTESRDDLILQGYSPCGNCKP